MDHVAKGKKQLQYDIVKYFLDEIQESPDEDGMKWYQTRQVSKYLEDIEISEKLSIKKSNKNQNLSVRFDLYKRESNLIDETFTADLFVSNHVEAYESIKNPPELNVTSALSRVGSKIQFNRYDLTIIDREPRGRVKSFNVYLKGISRFGNVDVYVKLGSIENQDGPIHFGFNTQSDLSVLRVIPVDSLNRESYVYTNHVIGPGHRSIGSLTIVPYHFGNKSVKVDVHNIPKDSISLTLYRRDCTDNANGSYQVVSVMKGQRNNLNATFYDEKTEVNRVYEYYVTALSAREGQELSIDSNIVLYRNGANLADRSISVDLSDVKRTLNSNSTANMSFNITTNISKTESQKITETLKLNYAELYEQYLNPNSNASSPLGEGSKGIPQYSDLFLHEVVRINLNTGERETFDLVSDGIFNDDSTSRTNSNVKPLYPQNDYIYQIFTFKKNPIELFRKYVARGVDAKGKEWFYLPYKWKNASARLGLLHPDDSNGVPVIDAYESFTSESFGLTTSYRMNGSTQYSEFSQVNVDRLDRNTIKVSWELSGISFINSVNLFDSFVVMKVVNGIRGFVGSSSQNHIYHELTEEDIGTIYYIVVPVMSEFDLGKPGYSSSLLVTSDGIVKKIKVVDAPT
jgi:hypothetical protein